MRRRILSTILIAAMGVWLWQNYTTTERVIVSTKHNVTAEQTNAADSPISAAKTNSSKPSVGAPPVSSRPPAAVPGTIRSQADADNVAGEAVAKEKAPATTKSSDQTDPALTSPIVDPATRGFRE